MTHIFQETWFDAEVEQAYIAEMKGLIETGQLDKAQERLLADLADLGSSLAPMATGLPGRIAIDGWDALSELIDEYEGEPITAAHFLFYNPPDLVFEDRDAVFEPQLDVALYSDEHFAFSQVDRDGLFAEVQLPDRPWYGMGEDIEVYVEINGMGAFNTALLRHKRQYHFRDQQHALDAMTGEDPDLVPLLYIEFVICALLRAVLFHRAVKEQLDTLGLPGNIPAIVSMDNMKFDIASVYASKVRVEKAAIKPVADLVIPIKRSVLPPIEDVRVVSLRQTISKEPEEKPGFLRRLFGFGLKAA